MSYLKKIDGDADAMIPFAGGIVEGGNVRTPCGPRRVELVRPGDLIVTRDTGLQPVRMVWKREVTSAQMAARPDLAPIRLKPRALGPMMPQKDLCLAPDHRVLVPGYRLAGQEKHASCLIEARELAGASDAAYVDRSAETVRCFTLIFDTHQVFCVNGLPVESFLPSASAVASLSEDFRDALVRRFPQLRREPNSYPPAEYTVLSGVEYLPSQV
ncbi:MAG: Hint domain-containing protein [Paracoccaceae bacterium]